MNARFDCVCFDFDSTLSRLEGIDELALRAGVTDEIAPLTAAAMDGTLAIDEIYGRRLEIVRPDRAAIAWLSARYIEEKITGAFETIAALQEANVPVHIVSGGLREAILPFAAEAGIATNRVHAVDIVFAPDGSYRDFDQSSPLTRPDGKAVVCSTLGAGHKALAMVGDGVTDVAARRAGAYVIGFGGVCAREAVRAAADVFVESPDLRSVLDVLIGGEAAALSSRSR